MGSSDAAEPHAGSADAGAGDPAQGLDAFFGRLPRSLAAVPFWLLTHPLQVARARTDLARLPLLTACPSADVDGRIVAAGLSRRSALGRIASDGATAVLLVPAAAGAYSAGGSRRTLRKKRNAAVRSGVSWSAVDDPAERRRLLLLANEVERSHPDSRYRTADPDNRDLLTVSRWWLARSGDGRPLVLAVVAVDGQWALLRYFRMLQRDDEATLSRFLLTEVVVDALSDAGVRYLATDMSPVRMTAGLRMFQHQIGFQLHRVRVASHPGGPARP